jgi:hypothetical protein
VAGSRSHYIRGSVHNSHNNKEFRLIQLIFERRDSSIETRREAERLGGLEVNDHLELARCLHRQFPRLGASQSTVNVGCRASN